MRNRAVTATPDHAAQDRPSPPDRQTSAIPPAGPALMRQRLAVTPPERYRTRLWCQARVSPPSTVRRQDRSIASAHSLPIYVLGGEYIPSPLVQWLQSNVSAPAGRLARADGQNARMSRPPSRGLATTLAVPDVLLAETDCATTSGAHKLEDVNPCTACPLSCCGPTHARDLLLVDIWCAGALKRIRRRVASKSADSAAAIASGVSIPAVR
jgi:hypothetical protein